MDETTALQCYLNQIGKHELLSCEEEKELAVKARNGDFEARKKLMESNLRFVVKIAKNYINYGVSLLDLIQEGNLGLWEAITKYDPARGCRLTTYCVWWIPVSYTHLTLPTKRIV